MTAEYVDRTERIGDLIVQVVADTEAYASNPRDNDNIAQIYGDHRNYTIGDGKPPSEHQTILERGGVRMLYRYMRRFGDPADDNAAVLAFSKLSMLDHSGISFYTTPIGQDPTHWSDPGGWDSGGVGYAYVSRAVLDRMGAGPDVDPKQADEIIAAEVKEYDDWARGNVWGFVISKPCDHADEHDSDEEIARCPHSETVDSCWGFIGDPEDVWPDAKATAEAETVPA